MDKLKELVKKIRIVDFIIVACVIIALGVGFVTYKGYRQTADKQIEATSNILFKVYMRGVTFSGKDIPIKKGEKIFVVVQDTKKQTVNVYTKDAKKTSQTVKMGTTWTVKATKEVDGKKIVRINKSQWLNAQDIVKD